MIESEWPTDVQVRIDKSGASPAPMMSGAAGKAAFRSALPAMWSAWCACLGSRPGQALLGKEGENRIRLGSWINDDGLRRAILPGDVGILLEGPGDDGLDLQGHGIRPCAGGVE